MEIEAMLGGLLAVSNDDDAILTPGSVAVKGDRRTAHIDRGNFEGESYKKGKR